MASYSVLKSKVTDIATCSICLEDFKSPRSLPCLHSFCLKCLKDQYKYYLPGDVVPCPLCREKFQIPRNGLDSLRVSFFMQNLVDAKNVSNEASGGELCEICSTETAEFYCVDCGQKLCDICSLPHKKMKGGRHDVRPLSEELLWLRGSYCDEHPDKRLKLYCFDCKVTVSYTHLTLPTNREV